METLTGERGVYAASRVTFLALGGSETMLLKVTPPWAALTRAENIQSMLWECSDAFTEELAARGLALKIEDINVAGDSASGTLDWHYVVDDDYVDGQFLVEYLD